MMTCTATSCVGNSPSTTASLSGRRWDAARSQTPPALPEMRGSPRLLLDARREAMQARDSSRFALDEAMPRGLMGMAGRPFVWQVITTATAQLGRVRFLSLE